MSRPLQNIFDLELSPRLLVEASAGTGKTYTIVGIFVRLLIEKELPPDQILVVTFTRMATRELKERILARLREALDALQNGNTRNDDFLTNLVDWSRDYPRADILLQDAIRNFDDTQVHTIHGFCQKVLKEEALLTGAPFEVEVSQADDLLQQAAEDFWRSLIHQHSSSDQGRFYLGRVMEVADSPVKLLNVLQPLLNKSYAEIEAPEKIDILPFLENMMSVRRKMKKIWQKERDTILRELEESNIQGLGKSTVEKRGEEIDRFLLDENFSDGDFKNLSKTTSSYLQDDQNLTTRGNRKPQHQFFDLCEEYESFAVDLHKISPAFLQDAADRIKRKRDEWAASAGLYSYDDLLNQLCKALRVPQEGSVLAGRLRARYPYALVDEFQDTDPVQYEIFDRIYSPGEKPPGSLMMIGDPKQAIYAFRGADVYAYLDARDSVNPAGRYTLQRNFRSTKNLINGINFLFSRSETPFVEEDIHFIPSEAGHKTSGDEYRVDGSRPVPVSLQVEPGIHKTEKARELAFSETAKQVASLIAKGQRDEATIRGKKLTGGDIAILISSHQDAEDLKQRLHAFEVDAVTYSRENVFESAEASRLDMLMTAILHPADRKSVQNVFATGFFGFNLNEIYNLQNREERLQEFIELLSSLHEQWQKYGFYPVFRKIMTEYQALQHFASFQNSERIITNLQQLAELCAFAERDHHLDGPSLLNWFRRRRLQSADEEDTLRLESDRDLVKISTIHNSKGLEFPVVFCPTLWYAPQVIHHKKGIISYHKTGGDRKLVLNLDQSKSAGRKSAYNQHLLECVAEEVRKTYVALTRAKYECRIFWTAIDATPYSGLGSLLIGTQKVKDCVSKKHKLNKHPELDDGSFIRILTSLAEQYTESFRIYESEKGGDLLPSEPDNSEWKVRTWDREEVLRPHRAVNSFSSLVHHDPERTAEPDYDQWLEDYLQVTENRETDQTDIFSFPRGAAAGTVIHKLFEHEKLDFRDSENPGNKELIREVFNGYGIDEKWIHVMHSMIENVCNATIGDLELFETAPEDQLREMEFHIPVREPELETVLNIIRKGDGANQRGENLENYLTGFIDLIVRQNGKYYILDYKSNHLGDSVSDYSRDALSQAVRSAGYDVQYHFYTLALVKMLRQRLPDFSYDKHIGGAAYLFIRGMKKGSDHGIWFHKPEERVIRNLEHALERSGQNQFSE